MQNKYVFLFLYVFQIDCQSNPKCRAKRYMCSPNELPENICVKVEDVQNKYYSIQKCKDQTYFCDVLQASYENDVQCQKQNEKDFQIMNGQQCSSNDDCYSKKCTNNICEGSKYLESCISHENCNVGLYCSDKYLCEFQKQFDQKCANDFECQNNTCCNNGICGFYFSVENGLDANNSFVCQSGYLENGKCTEAPKSNFRGQPCSNDQDCVYQNSNGIVNKNGKCQCGFNGSSFSYCELAEGDTEFISFKRSLLYLLLNNEYCHTVTRFGPCSFIPQNDYKQYIKNKLQYENYPQLQMNDLCVARTINWNYWQHYLKTNLSQ